MEETTGVICDKKISGRVKEELYKVLVKPAVMYEVETVAYTKRQEAELELTEMKKQDFFEERHGWTKSIMRQFLRQWV